MLLIVIAFVGGVFTVLSPCILPVVPFVFARSEEPFLTGRLPMLLGLALTFALLTGLGAAGLNGAAQLSEYGRWIALGLFALFGAALLFPALSTRLAGPLTALADRFMVRSQDDGASRRIGSAVLLGAATGLLWAPCAGPILGLIITGAARHGVTWQTWAALAAYAVGAASSLAVVAGLGHRAMAALKRSLGVGEHVRRAMGALVLLTVGAIALGLDTRLLALVPGAPTNGVEARLVDLLAAPAANQTKQASHAKRAEPAPRVVREAQSSPAPQLASQSADQSAHIVRVSLPAPAPPADLPVEGRLPALDGATAWLNSAPLTPEALRGKVVLVNFWTYSCINCLRTLPYLKTWAERYRNDGLVVIGVHTPEFGFEHDTGNVKRALANLNIRYPVAVDSDYRIWNAFGNQYWPAFYLVDAQGRVRYHHFGEGDYAQAEQAIQQLLADNGRATPTATPQAPQASGALAPADPRDIGSGETYVGYREAQGNANPERVQGDTAAAYTVPRQLGLNQWAFGGQWNVGAESAVAGAPQASIAYRFHARDLHLVLAPDADGKPVRFRISIDGAPPGAAHGADVAADGTGVATSARLYQLVRQSGRIGDHTFEIRFLDPGAHVYSFTFG